MRGNDPDLGPIVIDKDDRDTQLAALPIVIDGRDAVIILVKHVWNGVHTRGTSKKQRSAITRSHVFLNEKYLEFDAFERFKARLVAGNNKQDKDKTVQRSILAFGNAEVEVHI